MKFLHIVGAALAAALILVTPAFASVDIRPVVGHELISPANDAGVCFDAIDVSQPTLFVPATTSCDPLMAEITGLCLQRADSVSPRLVAAMHGVPLTITCASPHPGPPG